MRNKIHERKSVFFLAKLQYNNKLIVIKYKELFQRVNNALDISFVTRNMNCIDMFCVHNVGLAVILKS